MSLNLMKSLKNAVVIAALFSAGAANAALYQFTLTGNYTATWQLNSTVSPDEVYDGEGFLVYDVEGSFPGAVSDLADITFYNIDLLGGLEIYDFAGDAGLLTVDGPQLYTGGEDAPIFNLGTFALTQRNGTGTYTLTVTDLDAGPVDPGTPGEVPEPASIATMLGGLGLMAALRKRRLGK